MQTIDQDKTKLVQQIKSLYGNILHTGIRFQMLSVDASTRSALHDLLQELAPFLTYSPSISIFELQSALTTASGKLAELHDRAKTSHTDNPSVTVTGSKLRTLITETHNKMVDMGYSTEYRQNCEDEMNTAWKELQLLNRSSCPDDPEWLNAEQVAQERFANAQDALERLEDTLEAAVFFGLALSKESPTAS